MLPITFASSSVRAMGVYATGGDGNRAPQSRQIGALQRPGAFNRQLRSLFARHRRDLPLPKPFRGLVIPQNRHFYGVPFTGATTPFHVWNSMAERAGLKLSNAPKTWDAFWDFFKPVQDKLRLRAAAGSSLGLQVTTTGPNDGNNLFHLFPIANGSGDIVTKDSRLHLGDPTVKEAVTKSLTYRRPLTNRVCAGGGVELERRR
jgi:hypothetical protein